MRTVEEMLKPFENVITDKRTNYDSIMRSIISCYPELKEKENLFNEVAEKVQEIMQLTVSKYYGENLLKGKNGIVSANGLR